MLRQITVFTVIVFATAFAFAEDKTPLPGKTVEVTVTAKGFEPKEIKAKQGEQLNLVITRTVEETCATDVVIDEYKIKQKLPLNQAVTVSFTPNKSGKLKYGCAMNKMVGARIVIE